MTTVYDNGTHVCLTIRYPNPVVKVIVIGFVRRNPFETRCPHLESSTLHWVRQKRTEMYIRKDVVGLFLKPSESISGDFEYFGIVRIVHLKAISIDNVCLVLDRIELT